MTKSTLSTLSTPIFPNGPSFASYFTQSYRQNYLDETKAMTMAEIEAVYPHFSECFPNAIEELYASEARDLMQAFVKAARGVEPGFYITPEAKAWWDANEDAVNAAYSKAIGGLVVPLNREKQERISACILEKIHAELGWNEALNTPTWFGFLKS
jgi:hypothetical protein